MSVVANVLCSFASWVAYDGRYSRNGEIISESTDKAEMINSSVCVGYTGSLELAELVVLNLKEHVTGISDMKSDMVAQAIKLLLPNLKGRRGTLCQRGRMVSVQREGEPFVREAGWKVCREKGNPLSERQDGKCAERGETL